MSKYRALYKCLVCGRVTPHPYSEPREIKDECVGEIAAHMVNRDFNPQPYVLKEWPHSIIHYCFGDTRNVGGAIFAGFVRVDEQKGENDGSDTRE